MSKGKLFYVTDSEGKPTEFIGVFVGEKAISTGEKDFNIAKKFANESNMPQFVDVEIIGGRKGKEEEAEEVVSTPVRKSPIRQGREVVSKDEPVFN
ncbi:MAG: hypothetical protein IPO78_17365 [Saprospiraceae bacterium]|nr:hypothetical protein [Saprospiraceae bacterium]